MKLKINSWYYKFNDMTYDSWFKFYDVQMTDFCSYCKGTFFNIVLVLMYSLVGSFLFLGPLNFTFSYFTGDYLFPMYNEDFITYIVMISMLFSFLFIALLALISSSITFVAIMIILCPIVQGLWKMVWSDDSRITENTREIYAGWKKKYCPRIEWEY